MGGLPLSDSSYSQEVYFGNHLCLSNSLTGLVADHKAFAPLPQEPSIYLFFLKETDRLFLSFLDAGQIISNQV